MPKLPIASNRDVTRTLRLLSALVTLLSASTLVAQEVQLCNGSWTNKGCPAEAQTQPAPKVMSPAEAQWQREKKSLYHDLDMQAAKAAREYGIRHNIDSVRRICFTETTPVDKCRLEVEASESRLTDKIDIEVRKLALEQARNKTTEPKPEAQQSQTVVVVNQNNNYIRRPPGGYRYIDNSRRGAFETQSYGVQFGTSGNGTTITGGFSGSSGTYQGSGDMGLGRATRQSSGHFGR